LDYWQEHYQFDKKSPVKKKKRFPNLFDLIVINTLIPILFAFAKSQGRDLNLFNLINEVSPEKNDYKFDSLE
jgi:hypothetical protein